ncbi:MAG: ThiF family adenylyltransferase [Pirellulaceae bacterium]
MPSQEPDRYSRQERFASIGKEGQERLRHSHVLVCGCGALGSVIANSLVRAGVGRLRIVDRDFLELNNLQRQVLYNEDDVRSGLPKAIVAKKRLDQINSDVEIEAIVADINHTNIEEFLQDVDVVLDGTDNFETRFLINDAAVKHRIPWVYGGCIGAEGQTMTVLPGETACLRCLLQEMPPPGSSPTCDTAGILGTIINVIASIEVTETMKILTGNRDAISKSLGVFDLWDNRVRHVGLDALFSGFESCLCKGRDFPWLAGRSGSHTAALCGRNSVQLTFTERQALDLSQLAQKLAGLGSVTSNEFLVRFQAGEYTLTVFADGRAIISGTEEISVAKSLYARYVGS